MLDTHFARPITATEDTRSVMRFRYHVINTGEPCRGKAVSVHTIWNVLQHLVNQTKFNIASAPTHRAAHYFFRIRVHSHYDMSSIRCSRSVSCCRLFWLIFAKACALMNTVGSIGVASVVQTGILTTIYCLLCLCLAVHHIVHFRRPLVLILRFCDSVSLILELQVFHPRDLSEFGWKFCRVVPCFVYVNASAVFDFLAWREFGNIINLNLMDFCLSSLLTIGVFYVI